MHDRRTWLETLIIQIRSAVVEPGRLRHPTLPGLDGGTATAPTAAASTLSEMFPHVTPLFVVFQRPPLRDAA